jgi:hypothetical protein
MPVMGTWRQVLLHGGEAMAKGTLSQTALYGEVLTTEQQYRKDLSMLPCLTEEEHQSLLERACKGEKGAKYPLVESLLPALSRIAQKYSAAYRWSNVRIEYLDLVQAASVEMLAHVDEALVKESPLPYLVGIGRMAIRQACYNAMSTACSKSLDVPLEDDATLLDVLEESLIDQDPLFHQAEVTGKDWTLLYQALEGLHEHERMLLIRLYGFYGEPVETVPEIEKDFSLKKVQHCKNTIMCKLLSRLAAMYPEYVDKDHPFERKKLVDSYVITSEQEQKLLQAYQEMESEGQTVTMEALRARAHVCSHAAMAFLRPRKQAPSRDQRLHSAYMELEARGEPVTIAQLAKQAGVEQRVASVYFHLRQGTAIASQSCLSEEEAQRRLIDAYRLLETKGEKITYRSLSRESGVSQQRVLKFLKTMQTTSKWEEEIQARLERAYCALLERYGKVSYRLLVQESGASEQKARAFLKSMRTTTEREIAS